MLHNHKNSRWIACALAACCLVVALTPALADEPVAEEIDRAETVARQQHLSPMMQEIENVVERDRARALELESRVTMATDEQAILELQRQVEQLAQETELDILRVQVRHARLKGREDLAAKIEKDIADIQNPPVVRVRLERPELDNQ